MINNARTTLYQIYEFIKERPNFDTKSENDILIEFFASMHQGCANEFGYEFPHLLRGQFGPLKSINIRTAPKFINKVEFIEWLGQQLNSEKVV